MPIDSTPPTSPTRKPAVSMKTNGNPSSATDDAKTSRVVPASGAVMAASLSIKALNSVDFPVLGGPARTTRKPSRNGSTRGRASQAPISPASSAHPSEKPVGRSSPTSPSSEKSSVASIAAERPSTQSRQWSTCRDNAPPAIANAVWRCSSVSAASKSASPSASARSIRPLAKARRVNSPGSARRNPDTCPSADSTAATTARPPCKCNSAQSSPVALAGAGIHSTKPESSSHPSAGFRSVRKVARRDSGSVPAMLRRASLASGPLIRMTATPAGGAPDESAKIVWAMFGA